MSGLIACRDVAAFTASAGPVVDAGVGAGVGVTVGIALGVATGLAVGVAPGAVALGFGVGVAPTAVGVGVAPMAVGVAVAPAGVGVASPPRFGVGPEPPPEHAARAATQAHAKKTRPEGDGIEFASRSPAREACRADVRGVTVQAVASASISFASAKSRSVMPPASCDESVQVTSFQEIVRSG